MGIDGVDPLVNDPTSMNKHGGNLNISFHFCGGNLILAVTSLQQCPNESVANASCKRCLKYLGIFC